jgi:hypothetical protein
MLTLTATLLATLLTAQSPPGPPRDMASCDKAPKVVRPHLPKVGVYAAGGGLTSAAWRVSVDLRSGDARFGSNPKANSPSYGRMARQAFATLPKDVITMLIARAESLQIAAIGVPGHPIVDYQELIVLTGANGCAVFDGYGPFVEGPARELITALRGWRPNGQIARVELRDVQGLHGGRDIDVEADGVWALRVVTPGGRTTNKPGRLAGGMATLEKLIQQHDFFGLTIPHRLGIPDEAHPEISVILKNGSRRTVGKWAGDSHAGFDAIYRWLLRLEKR